MFDYKKFNEWLARYKKDFEQNWKDEEYKWWALKQFHDTWDINAEDFSSMLETALSKANNLLNNQSLPGSMIVKYATVEPNRVRDMFQNLFDESKDIWTRFDSFKAEASQLQERHSDLGESHFQDESAISTYLWLQYPDTYYIYKYSYVRDVAKAIESNYAIIKGHYQENLQNCRNMYNEIQAEFKKDTELRQMYDKHLTEFADFYQDPNFVTLISDFGHYIHHVLKAEKETHKEQRIKKDESPVTISTQPPKTLHYWWLNVSPKIWSISHFPVGGVQAYSLYTESNHKRRIFQNFVDAQPGDKVIAYETTPVLQVVALAEVVAPKTDKEINFKKVEDLTNPIDYHTLKEISDLKDMECFKNPNGSLFKLTQNEYDCLLDLIREENPPHPIASKPYDRSNFLSDVYMDEQAFDDVKYLLETKQNVILQGPPGVGKTFAAKRLAYAIMGQQDDSRIGFVQFHQNYSYEDFIMGYKPGENGFKLKEGVFYKFCRRAEAYPDKDFYFIIDEINRGNLSKIFGELFMLIEKGYRGKELSLPYDDVKPFSVPKNVYIIGTMNTADRSLAMMDYALRRRFCFFTMEPGFDSTGFKNYREQLNNPTFDDLVDMIKKLNEEIASDDSLGKGFCIGHSYLCGIDLKHPEKCTPQWMKSVVNYEILPMLDEYWFDAPSKAKKWHDQLTGVFHDKG